MTDAIGGNAVQFLKALVERVERVEEEKKALSADRKEIMTEAKAAGFDPSIINKVIKIRAMDPHKRTEQQQMLAMYLDAVGTGGPETEGEKT